MRARLNPEGNSLAAQKTSKEVNLALGRAMKEFKTNKQKINKTCPLDAEIKTPVSNGFTIQIHSILPGSTILETLPSMTYTRIPKFFPEKGSFILDLKEQTPQ